jgi:8-oxo-dGTP diphosphatase
MKPPEIKHFNIRVYGIFLNNKAQVLLSDELVLNQKMTKFPGGGMHFGEGTIDCLKREALEEFGQEIEVTGHFYTTDFFQRALFFADHQLISIYYRAAFRDTPRFKISLKPYYFPAMVNGSQSFRWADMATLRKEDMTFPVDSHVAELLRKLNQ